MTGYKKYRIFNQQKDNIRMSLFVDNLSAKLDCLGADPGNRFLATKLVVIEFTLQIG